ncbi:uncharacterized protein L969DRAFT_42705 [Mixia osmundae IAM 14324]|uniref:NodB homology domain-containing protein n=1 Tax=Mixia osmundae (strain CBS 9802 / IAM 14324 / JCM 22182 / KY 12970) TaxID=764103 RepID=G7DX83_MIXOS|nr:uncharacterized protein L969DRAFT_42705 [Mixia osmundae IAM 14324]KEI42644.1 hypothetical protein L969DRAFT_42705 [Mixia osmundae IAM 14324]GAA95193.1 hypothetical protein E5Q_01848 [Mixia osmundae IAM 14324]
MSRTCYRIAALVFLASLVRAQIPAGTTAGEGGPTSGPSSSPEAAGYTCDASVCKLPACQCASLTPPGGISPKDTPMFITWTNDDAVQTYTVDAVSQFLGNRTNPNGCPVKSTYFVSLAYTNYSLVTDLLVAGNEIADHTMTHVGDASAEEINGNMIALNTLAGVPLSAIQGFRAPFLNYTPAQMTRLHTAGFTYDSSVSAASPCDAVNTDCYWPYTLDSGFANDCLSVDGLCQGKTKLPGMWEIPMYATFGNDSASDISLMDPYLDDANPDNVLAKLKSTFLTHYNGNRAPFGLYMHPIHLASDYPGVPKPALQINMLNEFLSWAQDLPGVWIVTNQQLLAYAKNPQTLSNLAAVTELGCSVPDVSEKICNGMPANEAGLQSTCVVEGNYFSTCYGCPSSLPTPDTPLPAQVAASDGDQLRFRLPSNCSTAWFDPVKNECLCTGDVCAFSDITRPIGPNGASLHPSAGTDSTSTATVASFAPFSSDSVRSSLSFASLAAATLVLGLMRAAAVALAAVAHSVYAQTSSETPGSTPLYITEPACGFFECHVAYYEGSNYLVNWLNPPSGNVVISLNNQNDTTQSFVIAASTPATTSDCNAGSGYGVPVSGVACGAFAFTVPSAWPVTGPLYSISVVSQSDATVAGYTDRIEVHPANSTAVAVPATVVPIAVASATSVSGAFSAISTGTAAANATAASSGASSVASTTAPASSSVSQASSVASSAASSASASASASSTPSSSGTTLIARPLVALAALLFSL